MSDSDSSGKASGSVSVGMTWQPGSVIDGRYELISILGEGGFGVVYEAKQRSTGQRVAIKLLLPSRLLGDQRRSSEIARFKREMELIGKLRHPHIVRLIDFGALEEGSIYYMVLEYIQGESLSQMVKSKGAMSPKLAMHLMHQVADALLYAHALGIVHRDLKPQNIMITQGGFMPSATVLDFGIAGVMAAARGEDFEQVTGTRDTLGTPAYMAPEQIANRGIGPFTDIYAWGLVFAECLTGHTVASGGSLMQILMEQASRERVKLPEVIARHPLGPIIERASLKDTQARFASAQEVLTALSAIPTQSLSDQPFPGMDDEGSGANGDASQDSFMETMAPDTHQGGSANTGTVDFAPLPLPLGKTQPTPPIPSTSSVAPTPANVPAVAPQPNPQRNLIIGAAVAVVVVAVVVIVALQSGDKNEPQPSTTAPPTQPAPTTPTTAALTTPPTATPDADTLSAAPPDTSSPPPDTSPPAPPAPPKPEVLSLPQAPVTLGLDDTERTLFAADPRFADHIFDLDPETGTLTKQAWVRPALAVMTGEVTWALWNAWAGKLEPQTGCPNSAFPTQPPSAPPDAAVSNVTPVEAQRFCALLGMRLPSAREWEAIARGPANHTHGIDNTLSTERAALLNVQTRSREYPWSSTQEGIFDMAGNVSEWVTCGEDPLKYCKDGFAAKGSARNEPLAWTLSAALRAHAKDMSPCYRSPSIGFRCVSQ